MNRLHNHIELGQETINSIVNYLLENAQQDYATAVRNAAGQIIANENGNTALIRFSRSVNRNLCEALFYMNSDPNCSFEHLVVAHKLLENYRELHGMPTDDFEAELGPLEIEVDGGFEDEMQPGPEDDFSCPEGHCEWEPITMDEEDEIIGAVDIGEVLNVSEFISKRFGPADFRDRLAYEDDILDALRRLISIGVFEVLERDEYNGSITVVKRVR